MPIILPPVTRRKFVNGSLALSGTAMGSSCAHIAQTRIEERSIR